MTYCSSPGQWIPVVSTCKLTICVVNLFYLMILTTCTCAADAFDRTCDGFFSQLDDKIYAYNLKLS